jgi:hypothetical protein
MGWLEVHRTFSPSELHFPGSLGPFFFTSCTWDYGFIVNLGLQYVSNSS